MRANSDWSLHIHPDKLQQGFLKRRRLGKADLVGWVCGRLRVSLEWSNHRWSELVRVEMRAHPKCDEEILSPKKKNILVEAWNHLCPLSFGGWEQNSGHLLTSARLQIQCNQGSGREQKVGGVCENLPTVQLADIIFINDVFVTSENMSEEKNNWQNKATHNWSAALPLSSLTGEAGRQNEKRDGGKRERGTSGVCWSLRRFTAVVLTFTVPGRGSHRSHFALVQLWSRVQTPLHSLASWCVNICVCLKNGKTRLPAPVCAAVRPVQVFIQLQSGIICLSVFKRSHKATTRLASRDGGGLVFMNNISWWHGRQTPSSMSSPTSSWDSMLSCTVSWFHATYTRESAKAIWSTQPAGKSKLNPAYRSSVYPRHADTDCRD